MKNSNPISYAILNAAVFSPRTGDGWCQLMPAGRIKSRDGRPEKPAEGWLIDRAVCERMKTRLAALNQPVKVDYDHQSLFIKQGVKAPAAGYIRPDGIEWRDGEHAGIYVRPDWNPPAVVHLENREYAWLSAVMGYDDMTGEPVELRMVALTGDPALTGMQSVVALSADDLSHLLSVENHTMNEQLRQLLETLGLTVPEQGDFTAELGTAALSAFTEIKQRAEAHDGLKTQVTALSAELDTARKAPAKVDLTKYVPVSLYEDLRTKYAALSATAGEVSLDSILNKAEQEGRILKSERDYLTELGGQIGVAALSAQLDVRQPIAALTGLQTEKNPPVKRQTPEAALSADDLKAAELLGKTPAEFLKLKQEQA